MGETFGDYSGYINDIDVKGDKIPDGTNENKIKEQAKSYVETQIKNGISKQDLYDLLSRIKQLLERQEIERLDLQLELKSGVINETKSKCTELKVEYKENRKVIVDELSKIRNPGDLSRYIDNCGDESMKTLEKIIGIDNIGKILLLTGTYTVIELEKGLVDILKFGEDFIKAGYEAINGDLSAKEKSINIIKSLGIEGLRILALYSISRPILKKIGILLNELNITDGFNSGKHNFINKEKGSVVISQGKEIIKDSGNIYSKYPFLKKHKEFLGELEAKDILGEGQNAIIIRHPTNDNMVVKIAKEGNVDKIEIEFENHQKFFDTLQNGIVEFKGQISDQVKIPNIEKLPSNSEGLFIMERVDGQNLATKFYREQYSRELSKYPKDLLDNLTDAQFETLMEKQDLRKIPPILLEGDFFAKIMAKDMKKFFDKHLYGTETGNTLDFLEWKGLKHTDLHPGNIMVDKNGNTYIIDFGKVLIGKK